MSRTIPVRVRVQPLVDIKPDEFTNRFVSVTGVDAILGGWRVLLVAKLRRIARTKIEREPGAHFVGRGGPVLLHVVEVDLAAGGQWGAIPRQCSLLRFCFRVQIPTICGFGLFSVALEFDMISL